jgi:hypothetical protein
MLRPELDSDGTLPFIYFKTNFPSTIGFGDSTDVTKKLALVLTGITTGTTVSLTIPNSSGTIALIGGFGGAALTAGNDTNVTLTVGGSAATALLAAASVTAGWTGTLSVARGGTGLGAAPNLLSAFFADTLTASVVRGDLIIGNSTPKWSRLAVGTTFQLLGTDGTDTKWLTPLTLVGQVYSPNTPTPATPAAGNAYIFADRAAAGHRANPSFVREEGRAQWLQGNIGWNGSWFILPNTGATNPIGTGTGALMGEGAGTVTHPTIVTTSVANAHRRTSLSDAGGVASHSIGWFTPNAMVARSATAGCGGFYLNVRVRLASFDTTVNGEAMMCVIGFVGTASAIGNTVPSNLTDCVFLGFDGGDANLQIMYNDATGTCTKINLGTNYPVSLTSTQVVQFELYCAPAGTTIYYRVSDLSQTSIAPTVGSFNTNLPTATKALNYHIHGNTGTNAGADTITLQHYRTYCEVDI